MEMEMGVVVALLGLACAAGFVFVALIGIEYAPAEADDEYSEQGRQERIRKAGWR